MSESIQHMKYVQQAELFIKSMLPVEVCPHLLIDTPLSAELPPTMLSDAFRPDLYLCFNEWHIIGEAKTDKDCMREHSINQYNAYLDELKTFKLDKSFLIISCSMGLSPTMSNLFRRLKSQKGFQGEIVILNELGKYREL